MAKRILIINGHPDARAERLCTALCNAYSEGALTAAHEIRRLDVGALEFPLIRSADDFTAAPPPVIAAAQRSVLWADHLVIVFPLWMGAPPALLKAFFEQVFRYGFAIPAPGDGNPKGLLGGRSARLIVTMGMPGATYRWVFGAFGVRAVERSILWPSGVRPIRRTLIGGVGDELPAERFAAVRRLGARGG